MPLCGGIGEAAPCPLHFVRNEVIAGVKLPRNVHGATGRFGVGSAALPASVEANMRSFEEFKTEQYRKNPKLRRSSEAYLRQMYQNANVVDHEQAKKLAAEDEAAIDQVLLTTETISPYRVSKRIDIVSAECAFGMNIFRDLFAGVRDVVGGRSEATQKVLREARNNALRELKREAHQIGANGVIGVSLSYSEFSGGGKSRLFLVATGTAVKFMMSETREE